MIINQYSETCSAESEYTALSNIGMIFNFEMILSVSCRISFDISCRKVSVDLRLGLHFRSIRLIFLFLFLSIHSWHTSELNSYLTSSGSIFNFYSIWSIFLIFFILFIFFYEAPRLANISTKTSQNTCHIFFLDERNYKNIEAVHFISDPFLKFSQFDSIDEDDVTTFIAKYLVDF